MINKTLFAALLTTISASAQAQDLAWYAPAPNASLGAETRCRYEGEDFQKKQQIDDACFTLAYSQASAQQKAISVKDDLFVVAYKNIIYLLDKTEKGKRMRIISGDMAALADIRAVALSLDSKNLAVLDAVTKNSKLQTEVKIFEANRNGSVAPNRIMRADFLSSAVDLKFHPVKSEIYVLSKEPAAIAVLSTDADSRSSETTKRVVARREIKGVLTQISSPSHLVLVSNQIVVLDKGVGQILRFPLEGQGNLAPKQQALEAGGDSLRWLASENEIQLLDQKQEVVKRWQHKSKKKKKEPVSPAPKPSSPEGQTVGAS